MPVSLLLLPVLENHGDAEDEDDIDADDAKCRGKDLVSGVVGD
jgi:hypothetical protein